MKNFSTEMFQESNMSEKQHIITIKPHQIRHFMIPRKWVCPVFQLSDIFLPTKKSYVNTISSSSSSSSSFNVDPIVEEEFVWRTEKVKNIALVVKFETLPMFTQETDLIFKIFLKTFWRFDKKRFNGDAQKPLIFAIWARFMMNRRPTRIFSREILTANMNAFWCSSKILFMLNGSSSSRLQNF